FFGLGKELVLLFLDVMLDVLHKYLQPRQPGFGLLISLLEVGEDDLHLLVLFHGLQRQFVSLLGGVGGGIDDFLFQFGVNRQFLVDLFIVLVALPRRRL